MSEPDRIDDLLDRLHRQANAVDMYYGLPSRHDHENRERLRDEVVAWMSGDPVYQRAILEIICRAVQVPVELVKAEVGN